MSMYSLQPLCLVIGIYSFKILFAYCISTCRAILETYQTVEINEWLYIYRHIQTKKNVLLPLIINGQLFTRIPATL